MGNGLRSRHPSGVGGQATGHTERVAAESPSTNGRGIGITTHSGAHSIDTPDLECCGTMGAIVDRILGTCSSFPRGSCPGCLVLLPCGERIVGKAEKPNSRRSEEVDPHGHRNLRFNDDPTPVEVGRDDPERRWGDFGGRRRNRPHRHSRAARTQHRHQDETRSHGAPPGWSFSESERSRLITEGACSQLPSQGRDSEGQPSRTTAGCRSRDRHGPCGVLAMTAWNPPRLRATLLHFPPPFSQPSPFTLQTSHFRRSYRVRYRFLIFATTV